MGKPYMLKIQGGKTNFDPDQLIKGITEKREAS